MHVARSRALILGEAILRIGNRLPKRILQNKNSEKMRPGEFIAACVPIVGAAITDSGARIVFNP